MADAKAEETLSVVEAPKAEGAPAVVETIAPATQEPAPVPTAEASVEVTQEREVTEEEEVAKAEPIAVKISGSLELKHGLLHLMSKRRYFYFQDDAIESDNLGAFLKNSKKEHLEAAQSTAAYATQTGKGLLFYVKNESQKAHPIGIIKLADVTEVTPTGSNRFSIKLTHEVLDFTTPENDCDSWVHTVKLKAAEAKECLEATTSSEGFKAALEKFSKKSAIAAKAPEAKEKEREKEEKEEEGDGQKEGEEKEKKEKEKEKEKKEKKEKKKEKKEKKKEEGAKTDSSSDSSSSSEDEGSDKKGKKVKRSNSKKNKRTSIFAIIGHKDKKHEKEGKKEDKKEEKVEEVAKVEEGKAEPDTGAPADAPVAVVEEEKEAKPTDVTSKRLSFFHIFGKGGLEKKDAEVAKDREAISDAPPVIAPLGEEAKESEGPKPVDATPAEGSAKLPSSPPKESFLDKFFRPKEKTPITEAKKADIPETKPEDVEVAKEGEAVVEPDEKVAEASPKRRPSFFASLGRKDKKSSDVKSDTEEEPSSSKSTPGSPIQKGLNLFRKNSKSAKDAPKAEVEEIPPVPGVVPVATVVPETPAPATTETPATEEEKPTSTEVTTDSAPVTTA